MVNTMQTCFLQPRIQSTRSCPLHSEVLLISDLQVDRLVHSTKICIIKNCMAILIPSGGFTLSLTRLRIQGAPSRGFWKEKAVAGLFIRYGKPQCCEPLDSCFRSLHSVQSEFRSTDHGSAFLDPYFHLNTLRQASFFFIFTQRPHSRSIQGSSVRQKMD